MLQIFRARYNYVVLISIHVRVHDLMATIGFVEAIPQKKPAGAAASATGATPRAAVAGAYRALVSAPPKLRARLDQK